MDVSVKSFDVEMQIKNLGIEFEVRDTNGNHLGDLILSRARLEWCEGRTHRNNGKQISWEDFRELMNAR